MKPRKEWFSLLPPDVEKMALEYNEKSLEDEKESMHDALIDSFKWGKLPPPKGFAFWNAIANDEKYKN